jgi:hypothetical protein
MTVTDVQNVRHAMKYYTKMSGIFHVILRTCGMLKFHEDMWGSEDLALFILKLNALWLSVVNFTFRPLNLHGTCSRYPFNRQQERPRSRSARSGEKKNLWLLPEIKPLFLRSPLCTLVIIRAMLSQLVCFIIKR